MGLLKWFNKDNYATLGEVLSVIRKELQALQPKDSSDIVWNLSEDGLSAQLRSSNVGSQGTSEEGETVYTPTDTSNEYNGMHKLVLITDNSNPEAPIYKVCVCDGATYDPKTHTSKESSVVFSGRTFTLQSEIFTLEPKTIYVFVKVSLYECYYVITDTLPHNDGTFWYYHIGTAYYKDKSFSLHQEHTTGTLKTGESDYSGMHKLVLITDNSNPESPTYKVCVCDGATYDPKTHTSGASRVYVNGVAFDLKSEVFNVSNKYTSFYIVFTASTEDTEATVSYSTSGAYNDNQLTYSIGMFSSDNKAPYVLQQHTGNAVTLYWGVACDEFWK